MHVNGSEFLDAIFYRLAYCDANRTDIAEYLHQYPNDMKAIHDIRRMRYRTPEPLNYPSPTIHPPGLIQ